MTVQHRMTGHLAVVKASGELDIAASPELRAPLLECAEGPQRS